MERSVEKLFSNADKEDQAGKYKAAGDAMFLNQDWAGAFKIYEKGLHSLPKGHQDRATFHNSLSYCLMKIKPIDYAKVISHCSETLAIKPNDFPTLLRRAEAYEGLGEGRMALFDLKDVLQAQPDKAKAKEMWERLFTIEELKVKRDIELKALQNELEEETEKEASVSSLGLAAKWEEEWDSFSVDKELKDELEIPVDPAMIEEKPGSSVSSGDKELEKALDDDFAKKKWDKACNEGSSVSISRLEELERSVEKLFSNADKEDQAGKYKAAGDAMFLNQDWAGAFKVYEKGLHSLPKGHQDRATFHNSLSYCLMKIKPIDYAKVISHCSETLAIKPNDFPTLLRRAEAYEGLGEGRMALFDLKDVLQAQPDKAKAKEMWERLFTIEELKVKRDIELKALQNELEEETEKEASVSSLGLAAKWEEEWDSFSVDKELKDELEIPVDPAMIEEKPGSSVSSGDKELEKALDDDFAKKKWDKACNEGSSVSISRLEELERSVEKLFSNADKEDQAGKYKAAGDAMFLNQDWAGAFKVYEKGLHSLPKGHQDRATFHNSLSYCLMKIKPIDYAKVISHCSETLAIKPNDFPTLLRRAEAYEGLGEGRMALFDLKDVLQAQPDKAKAKEMWERLFTIEELKVKRDIELKALQNELEEETEKEASVSSLGLAAKWEEEWDSFSVDKELKDELEIPVDPAMIEEKPGSSVSSGDKELEKALDDDFAKKKWDKACNEGSSVSISRLEELERSVEKLFSNADKEDQAGKYKAAGDAMFLNQDWAGAFKVYEKGLHSLPKGHQDRATFHNSLSYCLMKIKPIDYAKVISHCSETLAIKPNDFPTLLRRAEAYEGLGEGRMALFDLKDVLQAQPDKAKAKEMWERLFTIEELKVKRDIELKALQNELEEETEKEASVSSLGLAVKWDSFSVDKELEDELEIPEDPAMIEEKPVSSVFSGDKELEKALDEKACNEESSVSISRLDKMDLSFEKLFSRLFGKDVKRILMMGTDTAGKTMILDKLKGDIVTTTTTISDCNVEIVEYKNINFSVWDVRGQDMTHYSLRTHGLIFVVESNDRGRIVEARKELNIMLKNAELRDAMLLVFANNQTMDTDKITDILELRSLHQQSWYVQGICASSGDGLYEGLDWLSKRIADKDFSAVDIRTDGAAQRLSPVGVAELQATHDLTLMECGNLHMEAAQNLFLSADNEMPSLEQLQSEFERVKQKYTLAKKCYDQALLVNPSLYVVFRALGELQVMMAKFHLDLAVQQNTYLSSWDSTEALELFDSAAENIEKWEKHGENGDASSEQMKFWGSMLFERSQVECISGVEGWEENLDSAVKYLRDGHVSEHQILSLLNNHYSRGPKSEAASKTLGESEFVAKIKADKVKLVTQARSLPTHSRFNVLAESTDDDL